MLCVTADTTTCRKHFGLSAYMLFMHGQRFDFLFAKVLSNVSQTYREWGRKKTAAAAPAGMGIPTAI